MKKLHIFLIALLCIAPAHARKQAPRDPQPKIEYDDVRDRTAIRTVDVWPETRFGYMAGWSYAGSPTAQRTRPESVLFRFFNNRLPSLRETFIWDNQRIVYFKFGDTRKNYPAEYQSELANDNLRGRYLVEHLSVLVPVDDFALMAKSPELIYQINGKNFKLTGKFQAPLAELGKTLPDKKN